MKSVDGEHHQITEEDLIQLEQANSLVIVSSFEENLIDDLRVRFKEYGLSMVITTRQRGILATLAHRFVKARHPPSICVETVELPPFVISHIKPIAEG